MLSITISYNFKVELFFIFICIPDVDSVLVIFFNFIFNKSIELISLGYILIAAPLVPEPSYISISYNITESMFLSISIAFSFSLIHS